MKGLLKSGKSVLPDAGEISTMKVWAAAAAREPGRILIDPYSTKSAGLSVPRCECGRGHLYRVTILGLEDLQREFWRRLGLDLFGQYSLGSVDDFQQVTSGPSWRPLVDESLPVDLRDSMCNNFQRGATARADESELPGESVYFSSVKISVSSGNLFHHHISTTAIINLAYRQLSQI